MVMEKCATQIPFTLSQCGVPTLEKCGSMCELCTVVCVREKCVYTLRRTHDCCYWLSAKLRFSNFCRKNRTRLQSQAYGSMVTTLSLSSAYAVFQLPLENASSMLSHFTILLTICRIATCAGAISANFESMKTNSTMLGLVTSLKMMMVVGVLVLQIVLPNSCSTIPGTLVVKCQFCSANASCH